MGLANIDATTLKNEMQNQDSQEDTSPRRSRIKLSDSFIENFRPEDPYIVPFRNKDHGYLPRETPNDKKFSIPSLSRLFAIKPVSKAGILIADDESDG